MNKAKTIIIGSGVVGASVAFHLTDLGERDVLLLESRSGQGLGATGKATGGVRSQFETEINIKLSQYSIDFFKHWDFECGYEPRGYLFFATSQAEFEYLKENVKLQKSLGVEGVRLVDPPEISEIVPGLNCADIVGGSFGETDGFIDPLAVMRGFTEKALAAGAVICFETEVSEILTANGKVSGVKTNKGRFDCENVVICTGAHAQAMAATAGIELPVEPLRRQIVWARSLQNLPENLPMVIDIGSGFHFRPAKDSADELLFAYPDADEKPSFKTEFEPAFIPKVYRRAEKRAGFLMETEPILEKCRAGLYANTPDHHAILGGCDVVGLFLANGFSGHGVMHSPATGRALAEIICTGEATFLDVRELSLERFAKGELLHETAFI